MVSTMSNFEALVGAGLYPAPRWLPQSMDQSRQWFRMTLFTEEDYRQAPFLDARGLREGMAQGNVGWPLLAGLTGPERRSDAHWIFHISHAGSTLVSRLLGECGDVLCLREPVILRQLFAGTTDEALHRLPVLRRLLSRCFRESQRAIVKATSHVSELAFPLVGPAAEGGKALFISIDPRDFIVARLTRDTSELAARAPARLQRLKRRLPNLDATEATSTRAHLAAMSWACEASSIEAAMSRIDPGRWKFLDFASFRGDPASSLADLARHFDIATDAAQIQSIVDGPLMRRYAKSSAPLAMPAGRQQEEEKTAVRERDAIRDALAWLERQRSSSDLIDRACARFDRAT